MTTKRDHHNRLAQKIIEETIPEVFVHFEKGQVSGKLFKMGSMVRSVLDLNCHNNGGMTSLKGSYRRARKAKAGYIAFSRDGKIVLDDLFHEELLEDSDYFRFDYHGVRIHEFDTPEDAIDWLKIEEFSVEGRLNRGWD